MDHNLSIGSVRSPFYAAVEAYCRSNVCKPGYRQTIAGLHGSALACFLAESMAHFPGVLCVITESSQQMATLEAELAFLRNTQKAEPTGADPDLLLFPDWETLPYDRFSPHQDIVSERLRTLHRLPRLQRGMVLTTCHTILHRLCPPDGVPAHTIRLTIGEAWDRQAFIIQLTQMGYYAVSQVTHHGEFAVRGSILDIFPMGSRHPLRIDICDDCIDSIRTFDPETQRTVGQQPAIEMLAAQEFPWHDHGITQFKRQWRDHFPGDPTLCDVYQAVSRKQLIPGLVYYLPLFYEKTAAFFDYLPAHTLIVQVGQIGDTLETFRHEYETRYRQYHTPHRPLLPPGDLLLPIDQFHAYCKAWPIWRMVAAHPDHDHSKAEPALASPLPALQVQNLHRADPWFAFRSFIEDIPCVRIGVETAGRYEVIAQLLQQQGIRAPLIRQEDMWDPQIPLGICITPFAEGFWQPDQGFAWITENALWGEKVMQRRRRQQRAAAGDPIRDLIALQIGDPVVHVEHGIGRYGGLETLYTEGHPADFVQLEYAGGDKLYIPIANLHLISRYTGSEKAVWHKLGGTDWKKSKRKALEKIRDTAAELLAIHAKRSLKPGIPFDAHDAAYAQFAAEFPFEETPDQAQAIEAVIQDMRANRHMDRLVCGDVGFGKTEVALRAAFLAAHHGKQVALLVPTTLLAEQHTQTFRDRFANWPIRVECLSRFHSPKAEKKVLADLQKGAVDILIGTHKLLQPRVQFKDLGLLIIDEEHRFGVTHKEKFKALRAEVDILTLTATPIPRTLNMALSQVRDLSIITTPPKRRLSIKTFVRERDPALIREAILREILRGGQVYFLHNAVDHIERVEAEIQAYVPEARVRHAHGQMPESQLERIMVDFYHQRFHVLVCTTIIETGIDIPTANTIIIDRADKLGLAQLHQLRGRVGRSHHQAYAYLFIPSPQSITPEATKRLEAIAKSEELGSGFALAMQDLEIRGSGDFLGDAQSGHVETIGYSLYMEYLEAAIATLKAGQHWDLEQPTCPEPEIQLHIPACIPDSYLPDVHLRLSFYQRLNHTQTPTDLQTIHAELVDRFGPTPEPVQHLLAIMALKQQARALGLLQVDLHARGGMLVFRENPPIHSAALIATIQKSPPRFRLTGPHHIKLETGFATGAERLAFLRGFLEAIRPS